MEKDIVILQRVGGVWGEVTTSPAAGSFLYFNASKTLASSGTTLSFSGSTLSCDSLRTTGTGTGQLISASDVLVRANAGAGLITLDGATTDVTGKVSIAATVGTPVTPGTPAGWLKISVNGTNNYLPLHQ